MSRSLTGTVLWVCLAGVMGATLFFIKHEVKDLETRLGSVRHDIVRQEDEIHVLNAEWSYLNDPVRLRDLAERHLSMKQMGPQQVATLDSLATGTALVLEQRVHSAESVRVASAQPVPGHPREMGHPPVAVAADAPVPQSRPSRSNPAPSHSGRPSRSGGAHGLAMASSLAEAR